MPLGHLRDCNQEEIQQFVLDKIGELVKTNNSWYHEPRQRFMRQVVLAMLQSHIVGYSRNALADILRHRDEYCDDSYTRRLVAGMINEGVLITAAGTEIVMEQLLDLDGRPCKLEGAATLNCLPVERPATVLRLSASRWLRGTASSE